MWTQLDEVNALKSEINAMLVHRLRPVRKIVTGASVAPREPRPRVIPSDAARWMHGSNVVPGPRICPRKK